MLQAKLTVSHPQDAYEQEADQVADQVMRMPESMAPVATISAPTVQRMCSTCEEEELHRSEEPVAQVVPHSAPIVQRMCSTCDEELHRSKDPTGAVPTLDAGVQASIESLSGRGSALPTSVRSFMEPRFQADFSTVRVHTDARAHELAGAVQAKAFTVGSNVVFGSGYYTPETNTGRRLLAHELTHVVQQRAATQQLQRSPIDGLDTFLGTRSEGSMAEAREAARAKADVEKNHWQLPDMERCIKGCHFSSIEARRWYTQYFLKYYFRSYLGEELNDEQLRRQMVYYEKQLQKGVPRAGASAIAGSAGKMSWVDEAMHPEPSVPEKLAAAGQQIRDYEELINSKDYKILQRPFEQRFDKALYDYREKLLDEIGEITTNHHASSPAIMPPQKLWDYGVANDLFAKSEKDAVFKEIEKLATRTYEKRFKNAQVGAQIETERTTGIGFHASPDAVWEYGRYHYLFLPGEKPRVLGDREASLKKSYEAQEERLKHQRTQEGIERAVRMERQGDQLYAPQMIIQPFAFGGLGWFAGAAYAGTQTGLLAGETYEACVKGEGDCASAAAQVGVAAATHVLVPRLGRSTGPVEEPAVPGRGATGPAEKPAVPGRSTTGPAEESAPPGKFRDIEANAPGPAEESAPPEKFRDIANARPAKEDPALAALKSYGFRNIGNAWFSIQPITKEQVRALVLYLAKMKRVRIIHMLTDVHLGKPPVPSEPVAAVEPVEPVENLRDIVGPAEAEEWRKAQDTGFVMTDSDTADLKTGRDSELPGRKVPFYEEDAKTQGIVQYKFPRVEIHLYSGVDPAEYEAWFRALKRALPGDVRGVYCIGATCNSYLLLPPDVESDQ